MSTREVNPLVSLGYDISANLMFQSIEYEYIADEINRFWAPRMRGLLLEYAANEGEGLSEALLPALDKVRK